MVEVLHCAQGSSEWYAARKGIPTASEYSTVMAKGKDGGASLGRAKYLRVLAGEIVTGEPDPDGFSNAHMERGKLWEDEARELYAFTNDAEPQIIGFIRNGRTGASPDSLLGEDGGLEIKTALRHIQIERLQRGDLPPEYRAQVQGCMWVTGRAWWDFMSYAPLLPPMIVRVYRDEAYIANIAKSVDAFNSDLDDLVNTIKAYGNPDALREALAGSIAA